MHRCFIEAAWIDRFIKNPKEPLPKEVLHRLLKVVRVSSDEPVALFDGQGREIEGKLSQHDLCLKETLLRQEKAPEPRIILLQASIEEQKLSETLKRGTEIGIDSFVIFNAKNSEPFLLNKLKRREERLRSLVTDAARQSGRLFVPGIIFADDLKYALSLIKGSSYGVFGDLEENTLLSYSLSGNADPNLNIIIVVGPEGGLSPLEKNELLKNGFHGVRWAPFTMRTELASIAAVAIVNAFLKRA